MNLLESAAAWLDEQRRKHLAGPVTYCRGDQHVELAATPGKTTFHICRDQGVFEKTESRDFLITATDLVLGGELTLPRRGDRIRETQDGKVYVYEVMAPGTEPCWRMSDPYRIAMRIHTKQVAVEEI